MNTWLKRGLIALIIFMILGAFLIVRENGLSPTEGINIVQFAKLYSGWVKNIFGNVKSITAYAVSADWLPTN